MTTKADFTEEEWARLGRAPLVAGMAITLADPGGPIETLKESSAALQTVLEAAQSGKYDEFVQAVAKDFAEKARHRQNPMAGFKPKGRDAGEEVLAELRAVNRLLVDKLDARGARAVSRVAEDRRPAGGHRGQGGRLPWLPRRARLRARAADARPARRGLPRGRRG